MSRIPSAPGRPVRALVAAFPLTLLAVLPSAVFAGAWNGSTKTVDGVRHVANTSTPMEKTNTIQLEEKWRRGEDESEEIIFALLDDIAVDEAGNVYVLDSQLSEVQVFSPDGEYLRTIGRRGEGPGEFNMARSVFITPDGLVAVVQSMPGKIVLLTPEGDAAGNYPLPESDGMMVIQEARAGGGHVYLDMRVSSFGQNQLITDEERIVRLDADGTVSAVLARAERVTDMTRLEFDEKKLIPFSAWAVDASGRTYVSADFDKYAVGVWRPDGTAESVIEREFVPRNRSEEERDRRAPMIRISTGNGNLKTTMIKSKTDRCVLEVFPREGGRVWVLSSRGGFDKGDGELCTMDEFDAEGRFVRQVRLMGEGDVDSDGLAIVGNRVFVLTERWSARRAMMAASSDSENLDDAEPMTLICYELPASVN